MPHHFAIGVAVLFIEEILKRPVDKKSNFVLSPAREQNSDTPYSFSFSVYKSSTTLRREGG